MKILIRKSEREFQIPLPANLLCSGFFLKCALKHSDVLQKEKAGETVRQIARELRRVKKRYGHWELVEVCSFDGGTVRITL